MKLNSTIKSENLFKYLNKSIRKKCEIVEKVIKKHILTVLPLCVLLNKGFNSKC